MGVGKSQFSEDELQDYQVLLFNNWIIRKFYLYFIF